MSICDWTLKHWGENGKITTNLIGARILDVPDLFISSSAVTKKGLITVLEATTGVIKNLRTDKIYISSTHDKRKGIYIVKTLGKSHSPSSPTPTNTGQLMKIFEELLTLHV